MNGFGVGSFGRDRFGGPSAPTSNLVSDWTTPAGPRPVFLEDFAEGVGLGNPLADTAALAVAAALPDLTLWSWSRQPYRICRGVICASNFCLGGAWRIQIVTGPGGFSSREIANGERYDEQHVLLHWLNADGGGWDDLEVWGDGGEYVCMPAAVTQGMQTQPFAAGRTYLHDLTLVTAGVALNSIGAAGWSLGDVTVIDCGLSMGRGWWLYNGGDPPYGALNPAGVSVDGDLFGSPSSRGAMGYMKCRNIFVCDQIYAQDGDQTDFITLAGAGANTNGCSIGFIDAERVSEPLDCQQSNVWVGGMKLKDVGMAKIVHGAQHCSIGPIEVDTTATCAFGIFGSDTVDRPTAYNQIGPVSGNGAAEKILLQGALSAGGTSSVTLPVSAKTLDGYYTHGATMVFTSGPAAGQEQAISAYVGSTRIATLQSTLTAAALAGDSFVIYATTNRSAVVMAQGSVNAFHDNTVFIGAIANSGGRKYDLYANLTDTSETPNCATLFGSSNASVAAASILTPGTVTFVQIP